MQFFGARANLAKCLLYAINGGVDEKSGEQVGPNYAPITAEYLDYDEVMAKYDKMMDWLVDIYVNTLNLIQYMHDNTTMRQRACTHGYRLKENICNRNRRILTRNRFSFSNQICKG